MESRTFTARWILPVAGPPLGRGTITVRGDRIVAVDAAGVRKRDEDLGEVTIIPGLVNAHTHLDLTGAAGLTRPVIGEAFPDWLMRVIAYRRTRTPDRVEADIRAGLAESLRHGVTLLGDISAGGASWRQLVKASLRAVVFDELIGTTEDRFDEAMLEANGRVKGRKNTEDCRRGLSPHAPYSVHKRGYAAIASSARVGVAVHLAESAVEMELLEHRSGPFVPFLQRLGVWEPDGLIRDPREFLQTHPEQKLLVVHGNYLSGDTPLTANQSLVVCPRTHAAFGHPPHQFREFLARGVNVAIGTDSLASNPDLDVLAELRELHRRYPDVPVATLLEMGTINGARALGFDGDAGTLETGKSADFVVLPGAGDDPHKALLTGEGARRTMFCGAWRS